MRKLHRLISQPIIPGHETDYSITQTMAEYLAHVHNPPFDGILFSSAQRKAGINIVIFSDTLILSDEIERAFRLKYVEGSVRLFSTSVIKYEHRQTDVITTDKGKLWIDAFEGDELDED